MAYVMKNHSIYLAPPLPILCPSACLLRGRPNNKFVGFIVSNDIVNKVQWLEIHDNETTYSSRVSV